jgi:hypothetical protein
MAADSRASGSEDMGPLIAARRSIDDPATLARAAHIIRTALARRSAHSHEADQAGPLPSRDWSRRPAEGRMIE